MPPVKPEIVYMNSDQVEALADLQVAICEMKDGIAMDGETDMRVLMDRVEDLYYRVVGPWMNAENN